MTKESEVYILCCHIHKYALGSACGKVKGGGFACGSPIDLGKALMDQEGPLSKRQLGPQNKAKANMILKAEAFGAESICLCM